MNRVLLSIFRKEITHILRDPQSLVMVLLMPVLMLFLYGYAITLDMKGIDTAIIDESRTPESRALAERLSTTDFFRINARDVPIGDIDRLFMSRIARCVLIIPSDYATRLMAKGGAEVELIIDASDPNAANFVNNYIGQVVAGESASRGGAGRLLFSVSPRIFYNPDMRSANFFVPGLIAVILSLISTLLTSIAIVREKETGTMEQLLVSPIRPGQMILGKVIPYTVIGFIDGILILVVGCLWFDVPIKGSLALVLLMMFVYTVSGISLGILISTITRTQAVAMLAAVTLTVLPIIMMSGFVFPIASMPRIFQYVSAIIPATYFLQIIRGVVLKGSTLVTIWQQSAVLLGMDVLLIFLSLRAFRVRLG
jgi:ABC-2 type transport system permease protein